MKVTIPKPCHEDLNKMTPSGDGRYCGSCEKVVVDFSKMTDEEMTDYFRNYKSEGLCGTFRISQTTRKQRLSHRLLISANNYLSNSFTIPYLKTALLLMVGFCMTLAGCESVVTGKEAIHDTTSIPLNNEKQSVNKDADFGKDQTIVDTITTVTGEPSSMDLKNKSNPHSAK